MWEIPKLFELVVGPGNVLNRIISECTTVACDFTLFKLWPSVENVRKERKEERIKRDAGKNKKKRCSPVANRVDEWRVGHSSKLLCPI